MREARPGTIYLKDYRPPDFQINRTELDFDLHEDHALVECVLHLSRSGSADAAAPLVLHGQELALESIELNGEALAEAAYTCDLQTLTIATVPDEFTLRWPVLSRHPHVS